MIQTQVVKNHYVFEPTLQVAPQLKTLFPGMKGGVVDGRVLVGIPASVPAARLLRNLGISAPSPIQFDYNWQRRPGITPRPHQIETAAFATMNPRSHIHNAMRCVDQETEFLTPTGWKKLPDYAEGDLVAQWNPNTDQAEFVEPLEYIRTPCTEMIHFKTRKGIDQMLTPQHRVVFYNEKGQLCETTAQDIHDDNLRTRGWRGKTPVTFKAPARPGIDLTDAEIRVMVAVIADGSFPSPSTRS